MTATRPKTWFITGASLGFGRAWTRAALKRGDQVAATARDTGTLTDLATKFGDAILPITLDVTDRAAGIAAVQRAHAHFGRLDVVVNNTGYGHFGFIEELTEAEVRGQIETNLLGPLWITQAAIPLLRQQGGGHILQISSFAGVIAFPGLGIYNASKQALEGLTESLAQEVAGFGITITLIEPGGFATDWAGSSATRSEPDPLYQPFRDSAEQAYASMRLPVADDSVTAIFAAVDAGQPPARLLLTSFAADAVHAAYDDRLRTWREWGTYLPLGRPCLT
jgi:NAD(P)-dependent dehydrogenase (short-subunit alcohol dehydrogenase family)